MYCTTIITVLFTIGFFVLPLGLASYTFVNIGKNWINAQSFCREMYTDLATINTAEEMSSLLKIVENFSNLYIYIGLHKVDTYSWHWSMSDVSLYTNMDSGFYNWKPGQPNSNVNQEGCAAMEPNGTWIEDNCSTRRKSVCFDANNGRYILIDIIKTWRDAMEYCRTSYTDLASVRNSSENQAVNMAAKSQQVWIGLFKDSWVWSDNSNSSFRFWQIGQPNLQGEDCVTVRVSSQGKWHDIKCSSTYSFICQGDMKVPTTSPPVTLLTSVTTRATATSASSLTTRAQSLATSASSVTTQAQSSATSAASVTTRAQSSATSSSSVTPQAQSSATSASSVTTRAQSSATSASSVTTQAQSSATSAASVTTRAQSSATSSSSVTTRAQSLATSTSSVTPQAQSSATSAASVTTRAQSSATSAASVTTRAQSPATSASSVTTRAQSLATSAASVTTRAQSSAISASSVTTRNLSSATSASSSTTTASSQDSLRTSVTNKATTTTLGMTSTRGTNEQNTTTQSANTEVNVTSPTSTPITATKAASTINQCWNKANMILVRENLTWIEAVSYCRDHHVDLVCILTEQLQDRVAEMVSQASSTHVWLGLRFTCTFNFWFWISNSEQNCYQNWALGHGNQGTKDCGLAGAMESTGGHQWVGMPESDRLNFICLT